ncbi:hypothetical protein K6119_19280 [Paracrocinitomix mangrovi]|uniref:hypothetical protein n=1 Tax=Paracrocinitomix mangrovi TaxID=2862509 RepID=UPI001C8E8A5C|nr:hypothetical protein [Paracrocinitomix mangrovi]UKN01869.1 hypothetical protein K6119_19280 [Paracrocinitomix mangrovi]
MRKLTLIALAFVGVTLVSCNKDQAAVKKLDGSWNATKMVASGGGFTIDIIGAGGSAEWTFNSCKLKNDEWCTGSATLNFLGDTDTENYVFRVTGDGTTLETKEHADSTDVSSIQIIELTKSNCVLKQVDGDSTTDIELEKK